MSEGGSVYRVELAKTGRSGCSATHCKNEGVKIEKGTLRQGVLVTIREHSSMKWRHWGCVTPAVLRNWKESSQMDMELVDGYDILPEDLQEKVKRALEEEHVDDDEWNGDQEMNRFNPAAPRQGMFVKTPKGKKKKDKQDDLEDDDNDAVDDTPVKKKASKKRGRVEPDEDDADEAPKPAKKKTKARATAVNDFEEGVASPTKPKGRGKKAKAETEEANAEPAPAKKSKSKKGATTDKTATPQAFVDDDEPAPSKKSRGKKNVPKDGTAAEEVDVPLPKKRKGRPKKAAAEDE